LAREIQRLQEDKLKIENNIQGTYFFFHVIPSFCCIQMQVLGVSIECFTYSHCFEETVMWHKLNLKPVIVTGF